MMFNHKIDDREELRLLEERHAEELFALMKRNWEHFRQWMPNLHQEYAVEDARNFIRGGLEMMANNKGFRAGIWYDGELAGLIGLKSVDWANRNANIGYWLGASFQGQGLVTKACRAVIDYAFGELKLHRIDILCAPGNLKSRAIPERLGFRQEGTFREVQWLYDHFVDLVIYGLLASEWQSMARPQALKS
jgi:ribosomal-protein-serine acetyltransferase